MCARETTIQKYFDTWLQKDAQPLEELFDPAVLYRESWGPEYHGIGQLKAWFHDWNQRGRVLRWDIKQFLHDGDRTTVEWLFQAQYDGREETFDGVSLIEWTADNRIGSLKEFGSKLPHMFPYGE